MNVMPALALSFYFVLTTPPILGHCGLTNTTAAEYLVSSPEQEIERLINELDRLIKKHGKDHIDVVNIHGQIAEHYRNNHQKPNFEAAHRKRQFDILQYLLENNAPYLELALAYTRLGDAYVLVDKEKGYTCYSEAYSILDDLNWRTKSQEDLLAIINCYLSYALSAYELKNYLDARCALEKALYLCKPPLSCTPEEILTLFALGACYGKLEDETNMIKGEEYFLAAERMWTSSGTEISSHNEAKAASIELYRQRAQKIHNYLIFRV